MKLYHCITRDPHACGGADGRLLLWGFYNLNGWVITCAILLYFLPFSSWMCPASAAPSAAPPTDRSQLTLERIFTKKEFQPAEWGPARWLENGQGYVVLEESRQHKSAKEIMRYDPQSGRSELLVSAARLIPTGKKEPLKIDDYVFSPNLEKLLIFTNSQRVWRQNTRGDYWLLDRKDGTLRQLGGKAEPAMLMFATLSPDGGRAAYVYKNNLYVQDLGNLRVRQLTRDGSATIINGTSDWVNEEELNLRSGFKWSPDGKFIAYWQFDTSGVSDFHLFDNTSAFAQKLTTFKYPKAGETNSACRVGIIPARGGKTCWLPSSADPRNHYLPQLQWTPDSNYVLLQRLNRLQNTNTVLRAAARTGKVDEIFVDRDAAWVDVVEQWPFIEGGKRFLWLSERAGWRQLYAVSVAEGNAVRLTNGQYDVVSICGIDAARRCVYFIASPDNPTQRYLYRVALDGAGECQRVTPRTQSGTHAYEPSKDGRWAIHTWSRFDVPPVIELVSLPGHNPLRTLAGNAVLRTRLHQLTPWSSEFFQVDIGDGVRLDAWCIKPPRFDPAQKYPLLVHVYGEPAGQTVVDRWGGDRYLWHAMLAQQGYLVMSIDNRGTNAPRGRQWRKCIYRQVGILAAADQAAATRRIIAERPWVDPARIGIWGWSGGGSMTLNAIFRYPGLYRTGIAIAFISNQRYYDTIYQERYMGLPKENAEGYKNGSPITYARQLKGNLLLVYGTADDNCHYQNCEALIDELIKWNKPFSMMSYPNRTHAIKEGPNTTRHLFETMTGFLKANLPAGPR